MIASEHAHDEQGKPGVPRPDAQPAGQDWAGLVHQSLLRVWHTQTSHFHCTALDSINLPTASIIIHARRCQLPGRLDAVTNTPPGCFKLTSEDTKLSCSRLASSPSTRLPLWVVSVAFLLPFDPTA